MQPFKNLYDAILWAYENRYCELSVLCYSDFLFPGKLCRASIHYGSGDIISVVPA